MTESETIVEEEDLASAAEAEIAPVVAMAASAPESQEAASATQVEKTEAAVEEEMTLVVQALDALEEAAALGTADPDAAIASSPGGVDNPRHRDRVRASARRGPAP